LFLGRIVRIALQKISGIDRAAFDPHRFCPKNSLKIREVRREPPRLEDLRPVHQGIVQVRKDRIAGKADAAQELTLLHTIAGLYGDTSGLHVHQQAIFAVLVIEHHEIADIFRVLFGRELGIPDLAGARVFEPVFRNVVNSG